MQKIERIKVYGERDTGTNFLQHLISANFETAILPQQTGTKKAIRALRGKIEGRTRKQQRHIIWQIVLNHYHDFESRATMATKLGWKHMRPPIDFIASLGAERNQTLFVVIVKHPVFWARSFQRKPYHDYFRTKKMEFGQYLRHMYIPSAMDNVRAYCYDSVIELYADKIDGYRELSDLGVPFELVRYEALLADIPAFLDRIASKYGLIRRENALVVREQSTKRRDSRNLSDFRSSYTLDNIRQAVCEEDYAFIISKFGEDRLKWLGYPPA